MISNNKPGRSGIPHLLAMLAMLVMPVMLAVLATLSARAAGQSVQTAVVPGAVEQVARASITRATLEAPIRFLSSDLLEGRGPATRGDELTRLYLQTQLEGMGYAPAFARSWQQPFEIVGIKSQFPQSWSFRAGNARLDLAWRDD